MSVSIKRVSIISLSVLIVAAGLAIAFGNFANAVGGTIVITSPGAIEEVPRGAQYNIQWTSYDIPEGDLVSISLENPRFMLANISIATNTENDGSFMWQVPYDLAATSGYEIVINGVVGNSESWPFYGPFGKRNRAYSGRFVVTTLDVPIVTAKITQPSADSTVSDVVTIAGQAFSSTGSDISNIMLRVLRSGSPYDIASGTPFMSSWLPVNYNATYRYLGSLDTRDLPNGRYYIEVMATESGGVSMVGGVWVTIDNPPGVITITSPVAGEQIDAGTAYNIQWTSSNIPPGDRVGISIQNSASWGGGWLDVDTENDGSFMWQVPSDMAAISDYDITINGVVGNSESWPGWSYVKSGKFGITRSETPTVTATITTPSADSTVSDTVTITGQAFSSTGSVISNILLRSVETGGGFDIASVAPEVSSIGSNFNVKYEYSVDWNTRMLPNGRHYIEVMATESGGLSMIGGIWVTINNSAGTITITSPVAGEQIDAGTAYNIQWTSSSIPAGDMVRIDIFNQTARSTLAKLLTISTENDGSFIWQVPFDMAALSDYYIRFKGVAGNSGYWSPLVSYALSGKFGITRSETPTVTATITTPSADSTVSDTVTITGQAFSSTGSAISNILLRVIETGGGIYDIASGTPRVPVKAGPDFKATYEYSAGWNTRTLPNGRHYIEVMATESGGLSMIGGIWVTVDNSVAKVTITSPAAGEEITRGAPYTIKWTSSNVPDGDTIRIRLLNEVSAWNVPGDVIVASTENDGSFVWQVPSDLAARPGYYMVVQGVVGNSSGYPPYIKKGSERFSVVTSETPTVTANITAPIADSVVSGVVSVAGQAISSTGSEISNIALRVLRDGAPYDIASGAPRVSVLGANFNDTYEYSADWDTRILPNGRYYVEALATESGGLSMIGGIWVTIDNSNCLPDNTLVKLPNDAKIYVIKECQRRWIRSLEEFNSGKYKWENIKEVAEDIIAAHPEVAMQIAHRSLFRFRDRPDVYVVRNGTLYKIPNEATLIARGLTWEGVRVVDRSYLDSIPRGFEFMPEGALFRARGTNDVWIVKYVGEKQFKRLVLNPRVFESYGHLRWEDVRDVDAATMNVFPTATLVRIAGTSQIYRLTPNGDIGVRQRISSARLAEMGLDVESVYEINATDYDSYKDGEAIE